MLLDTDPVWDAEKLYAIVSLNENSIDFSKYANMYDLMAGGLPGLTLKMGL